MATIASRQYTVGVEDNFSPLPSLPVCVCSTKDVWQRGLILFIGKVPNTYTVLYVDYGDRETLSIERIKPLEASFATVLPPQSITCGLPVLLESDMNPDLPQSWTAWELSWPISCDQLFRKLTSEVEMFYVEPLAHKEDSSHIVKLFTDQVDVRTALVANLQDPNLCVIKEDGDTSADNNGGDTSREDCGTSSGIEDFALEDKMADSKEVNDGEGVTSDGEGGDLCESDRREEPPTANENEVGSK